MEQTIQLDIPLSLPKADDTQDQRIEQLRARLSGMRGVLQAHVEQRDEQAVLCLHFDPGLVSLAQVRNLAEQSGVQVSERYRHELVRISCMDCADCAFSIEHVIGRKDGVLHVSVNYAAETMAIEYDSERVSRVDVERLLQSMGYGVAEEPAPSWLGKFEELLLPVLSGLFLALGYFGSKYGGLSPAVATWVYILAYLSGGYEVAWHGIKAALRGRFDIEFLMVVAAAGAALVGEWAEGALLLFLFSFGHALEHYATSQARRAVEALGNFTPKTARVRRDGREMELPVEQLQVGDAVIVKPGERVPVDGKVLEGQSAVDQSPLTGESMPVEKVAGAGVFAGSLNGDGALIVEVVKLAHDTTMARVMRMVEEAQTQRSPSQRFTERVTRIFVPATLLIVFLTIVAPPLVGWLDGKEAFLRGMAILVAASPCALALATPAAVLSGIAQAARHGVLVKGGVHLENLGALQAIAFDKTGTITRGKPEVIEIFALPTSANSGKEATPDLAARELLRLAAAVESQSSHPLAQAVVRRAGELNIELPRASDLQSTAGRGLRAIVNGETIRVGNLKLFEQDRMPIPAEISNKVEAWESAARTTMIVSAGERFLGVLALADVQRSEAKAVLERLRSLGVRRLVMLTGDNDRVASSVARAVGITEVRANLMPDDKLAEIKKLLNEAGQVAMIGDGVNDAPALALATVGIAMGAGGTDVALETADVALMADDLAKLPFAVALSRQSRSIIRQNLLISLGVVAVLVPAALFGATGIGAAILFHEGSTLLVVANALRLLRFQPAI